MKRYKIKQKPFAVGGKYIITDDFGHEEYVAKGKPFSFRNYTALTDSLGEVIYEFHKQLFSWKLNYFIHDNGSPVYRVFKNRVSLPPEIFIESLQESEAFYVKGNFWGREYGFFQGENQFASVNKELAFADTYRVEVDNNYDHALILVVVIIIDLMKESKKKKG